MNPVATSTDSRAWRASATVKKRIRMCGRPAVPKISATPSEMAETGSLTRPPGAMMAMPLRVDVDRGLEQCLEAEAEMRQDQARHQGAAAEQQHRLDDLHPGGGHHAAERDIGHHQHAHEPDGHEVGQAEQQLDQLAGTHQLRDQVEQHDHQRVDAGDQPHRHLREAVGGDVGEGVAAEVAQRLGDQEQDHREADQEADGVDHPVIAGRVDQRRHTQERGGRSVVAGDGEAVLDAAQAAAGRVIVAGRPGAAARRPEGDAEADPHEDQEHADGRGVQRLPRGRAGQAVGAGAGSGQRQGGRGHNDVSQSHATSS